MIQNILGWYVFISFNGVFEELKEGQFDQSTDCVGIWKKVNYAEDLWIRKSKGVGYQVILVLKKSIRGDAGQTI